MLHLENTQRTTLSSGVQRDRNVSSSITAAGWPPPSSHMLMKQRASYWLPMSEGLQLLEVHSRKEATSPVILSLPLFTPADTYLKWATLPSRSTWETQNSFLHHWLCGKLLWWRQRPRVTEKNIRSVTEKCVFLALKFSEHMEALICRLAGGIRSALRHIKIPPCWICERVCLSINTRSSVNSHQSLTEQILHFKCAKWRQKLGPVQPALPVQPVPPK